eukprot:scaffold60543_cov66-Phaeocystis_antarctica.AAC.1
MIAQEPQRRKTVKRAGRNCTHIVRRRSLQGAGPLRTIGSATIVRKCTHVAAKEALCSHGALLPQCSVGSLFVAVVDESGDARQRRR